MNRLSKETELLETQRQIAEAQLNSYNSKLMTKEKFTKFFCLQLGIQLPAQIQMY
ncbi:MAG: hypothetical protein F6K47_14175 [Symploca sp. SIO2E6]|nr:hypothetical protein [Symploca sp. SIO2E6]